MEKEHLEILLEDISGKFDLVLEGHASLQSEMQSMRQDLTERIGHVDFKVEVVNKKIDAVAVDLASHRADTEAHHGVYRVRESGE